MSAMEGKRRIGLYGIVGLAIMVVGEMLLLGFKSKFMGQWFTPVMWTGYILFIDSLVFKLKGESLIRTRTRTFVLMSVFSFGLWEFFEFYNLFIRNWHYVGLPENLFLRRLGDVWAFATVWPGILETAELILALGVFRNARIRRRRDRISKGVLYTWTIFGFLCVISPFVTPAGVRPYLAAPVWMGYAFFLDPINYWIGARSVFGDIERGSMNLFWSLFLSGLICGVLWEFWNYWATAKWIYTVPILGHIKIFEMPVIGYLGFLPFAMECYTMFSPILLLCEKIGLVKSRTMFGESLEMPS